ncbi:MAG: hypothetical protein LH609_00715, partial [Rudanella sp.]|nr:hypothetical protein [Rudanella sp.]
MNRTTLQARIVEEIVLRRGQVKERQWRQTGLPDEAARDGISAEEFRRLVNEVSRQINFEKLADLRRRLEDALDGNGGENATRPGALQYQLHQLEEDDFVAEGERMGLSASFIEDRWIPQLIADLKKENNVADPVQTPDSTSPPAVAPARPVIAVVSVPAPQAETLKPAPVTEPSDRPNPAPGLSLRERVKVILDEYQGHISARDLRLLFRAMHTDERVLAEEILAYMSANFYASETEPQGATLPEKLLSTDWRHLAWWDTPAVAEPTPTPAPEFAPTYTPPAPEPTPAYVAPRGPAGGENGGLPPAPQGYNGGWWGGGCGGG